MQAHHNVGRMARYAKRNKGFSGHARADQVRACAVICARRERGGLYGKSRDLGFLRCVRERERERMCVCVYVCILEETYMSI